MMATPRSRAGKVHSALLEERERLLLRIAALNRELGTISVQADRPKPRRQSVANALQAALKTESPLIRLVLEATRKAPLPIAHILDRVVAAKYQFASKKPLKELTMAMSKSEAIKDYGGKFGPSFAKQK